MDPVAVVEAAYRPAGTPQQWLEGIVEPVNGVFAAEGGMASVGFLIDARRTTPEHAHVLALAVRGAPFMDALAAALELGIQPESILRIRRAGPVSTLSEALGDLFDVAGGFRTRLRDYGISDVAHVLAGDPSGVSCVLAAPHEQQHRCSAEQRLQWELIAAHIAAGFRLRLKAGSAVELESTMEAVIGKS